eukprot:2511380-Rhodomonas_salina.1
MTRGKSCCPGFGNREMDVYPDDLLSQCEDDWNLWLVSEGQGNKTNHYFYKLVLIPKRTPGLGNKSCLSYGWLAVGAVDFNLDNAYEHLADMIRPYLQCSLSFLSSQGKRACAFLEHAVQIRDRLFASAFASEDLTHRPRGSCT